MKKAEFALVIIEKIHVWLPADKNCFFIFYLENSPKKYARWLVENRVSTKRLDYEIIRSDEGLTLETSAFESLYGGQFTLSTQVIKPNYLVILPPTQHHSFFRNFPPFLIRLWARDFQSRDSWRGRERIICSDCSSTNLLFVENLI